MRAIRVGLSYSSRSCTAVSTALVLVLTFCFSGIVARGQTPAPVSAFQNVVVSQETELGAVLSSGGGQSGQAPAGGSMAVDANGDVIMGDTYGADVLLFSGTAGGMSPLPAPTVLGSPGGNPDGMAIDSKNNLFVGFATVATVVKIPFVSGQYVPIVAPSSSTPNCTGTDTVECVMSNLNTKGSGVGSLVFDASGDLFYSTTNIGDNGAGTSPNSIWECTAACLYTATGTPAATLLYTEPTSGSPTTTGQLNVGGLAVDPYGDLFFTDSAVNSSSNDNQESFSSNLNELVYTAGTGFAAAPTVLYSYTPSAPPSDYDAEIDGVSTDASGTVYALIQNTGGILAFPNNKGVVATNKMYLVSTVTGKLMTNDALGNLYVDTYISGDAIVRVGVDNVMATASAVSAPSTTTLTTLLNDGGCTPAPMITFSAGGTSSSEFSAATSGACATTLTGSSFATTLTFTPTAVGTASATLTATDTNGNSETAAVAGVGEGTVGTPTFSPAAGAYTTVQTVTISDPTMGASIYYTTDGSMPGAGTGTSMLYTGPLTVSDSETLNAIAVDSGDTSSAVATAAYSVTLAGANATPTLSLVAGTYTSPEPVTITDTTSGASIYYTTDGSAPTASSNLYIGPIAVSSTETINAIAIGGGLTSSGVATALYTINLPASALQDIVINQDTTFGKIPSSGGTQSGSVPDGDTMAVNSLGQVITTDTYGSEILLFTPQGTTPTVLGTVSNPNGVAVDSQNNLYIGFSYNASVVKIPFVNGAYAAIGASVPTSPACTGTDTVECVMTNLKSGNADVVSLVFDSKGDAFYSTGGTQTGGTNNAIFECTAACLYTGSPAATVIFQEPTSATAQLSIGGLALDTSGNLFFTDSAISASTSQESSSSNLNELVYTSGTGYATTATVIYAYTPPSVVQYGPELDGVAVAPNGTLYALLEGSQGSQAAQPGILAFPKASGAYSGTTSYVVSTDNGKAMTSDGLGNLYIADDGGNIHEVAVDNITAPTSPEQNPATATNLTTILNDGGCTATPPTVTFAASGTSASAFSAATTAACVVAPTESTGGAASFATTVTFSPTSLGTNTATLTATDSLKNTGTAAVSGVGTPAPPAATPTFSVAAGTYTTIQMVTLTDTTAGTSIYYTVDGSTPTAKSTLYSGPISVGVSETINAIAAGTGFSVSPVASAAYVINLPVAATPTFSVAGGTYTTPQTVSLSDTTAGAVIYYTLDGSTPTGASASYSGPITVGVSETINAIAVVAEYSNSSVGSAVYTINLPVTATPTFSVAAGTYTTVQTVTISDATAGAAIYYTLDGSTPGVGVGSSTLYTGSNITVGASTTIKAVAVNPPNYNNSVVGVAAYVINLPAPGFTITTPNATVTVPPGGNASITLTVTANAAFNGTVGFTCTGFLPIGASCAFSPTSVTAAAGGNGTTKLTVTLPSSTASVRRDPSPVVPGAMLATALCLLGFRKRRRVQMLLLFMVSVIGFSMFTGCTTTSTNTTSSSQFVVAATGSSCPVTSPGCTSPTAATTNFPLVLTVQ